MEAWGRILVALVVPVAWGLVSAWFFDWLRLRQERKGAHASAPGSIVAARSENEGVGGHRS